MSNDNNQVKKNIKLACDDGSSSVKIVGEINGEIKTLTVENRAYIDVMPSTDFNVVSDVYRVHPDGTRYIFDENGDTDKITNLNYQFSDRNACIVRHAIIEFFRKNELKIEDYNIDVAFTLPLSIFDKESAERKKQTHSRCVMLNEQDTFDFSSIKIFPESAFLLANEDYTNSMKSFLAIDFGSRTTCLYGASGSLINPKMKTSYEVGTYEVMNEILKDIRNKLNSQATIKHADQLLKHWNNEENLKSLGVQWIDKNYIFSVAKDKLNYLIDQIISSVDLQKFTKIVVGGGASALLVELINYRLKQQGIQELSNIEIIADRTYQAKNILKSL